MNTDRNANTPAPVTRTFPLHVGVCGTTANTVLMAQALHRDPRFVIDWVITPPPKPIGRKQVLTPSALQTWAESFTPAIPVLHVQRSLKEIREEVSARVAAQPIDFLLVVDFGYLVPQWMLDLPRRAPINIHPSDLPQYRGSSPGQFVILYGETESAVCIMQMDAGLDTGPIIARLPLRVEPRATAASYYQSAFIQAENALPETLVQFANHSTLNEQKNDSEIFLTSRLSRQDGYIPYSIIESALTGSSTPVSPNTNGWRELSPHLQRVAQLQKLSAAELIDRALRAFTPWPGIWTRVPDKKEQIRVKILSCTLDSSNKRKILDVFGVFDGAKQATKIL